MNLNLIRWLGGVVILGVLLGACAPDEPEPEAVADPDTLEAEEVEGLTEAELQERAEAMTQEEAIERGVLDTTIWVEDDLEGEDADTVPPALPENDG